MHRLIVFLLFLLLSYVALFIVQLWFDVFAREIFFKLTITFGVLFLTALIVIVIKNYLGVEEKLKRDKFID